MPTLMTSRRASPPFFLEKVALRPGGGLGVHQVVISEEGFRERKSSYLGPEARTQLVD